MSQTLHTSEKTHQGVLPQPLGLESVSAGTQRVGMKRGSKARPEGQATGMQHGRGETGNGASCPSRRNLPIADKPVEAELDGSDPVKTPKPVAGRVFVLDCHGEPLDPCHPARARRLLASGRAVIVGHTPFVIRLKDRGVEQSTTSQLTVKIDPGSRHTGMSVARVDEDGNTYGLVSIQLDHRGQHIHKKMGQRAAYRRGRRSRNLRYRAPRFSNRSRPKGWLAPSLQHRVDSTVSMVSKLCRWAPVSGVAMELVRFDTQVIKNPEISGVEYHYGALSGYEVREYLLEKWNRTCAYCGAKDVPLNIDHIHPRSRGGNDRVSDLALSCIPRSKAKDNRNVEDFLAQDTDRLRRIKAQAPLKDAAAVNATRWALYRRLSETELAVSTGTGGRTKWNRSRFGLGKSHTLDALCAGTVESVVCYPSKTIVAKAAGRGVYQRTRPNKHGFPRLYLPRTKSVHEFQTGDLVRAVVPSGKKSGVHLGRVAVRTSGSFNVGAVDGISHRYCTIIQRSDGWEWSTQLERRISNAI